MAWHNSQAAKEELDAIREIDGVACVHRQRRVPVKPFFQEPDLALAGRAPPCAEFTPTNWARTTAPAAGRSAFSSLGASTKPASGARLAKSTGDERPPKEEARRCSRAFRRSRSRARRPSTTSTAAVSAPKRSFSLIHIWLGGIGAVLLC